MNETRRRLIGCFTAIFDGLSDKEACSASVGSLAAWDSIAVVTLVSLVEEEFRIQIAPGSIAQLTSFDAFYQYIEARSLAA
jgi:acyl carrier protein